MRFGLLFRWNVERKEQKVEECDEREREREREKERKRVQRSSKRRYKEDVTRTKQI